MVKHIIKHFFQSSLTPDEIIKFKKGHRYWSIFNLETKEKENYLKVDGTAHLAFHYPLNKGTYHISNNVDKYILTVNWDGKFFVKDISTSGKIDNTVYLFVD